MGYGRSAYAALLCALVLLGLGGFPAKVTAQSDKDRQDCFSENTDDYKDPKFYDIGYDACDKFIKSQRFSGPDLAYYVRQRADWLRRKKEYSAALRDFAWAIELDPKHVEGYDFRGDVYMEQGQYERALDDYNKSIEINPGYAPAYYARGLTLERLGRIEDAKQSYRLSLSKQSRDRLGDWAHSASRIRLDYLEKR